MSSTLSKKGFRRPEEISDPFGAFDLSLPPRADDFTPGLVSIIMPCYNAERFLRESIESVLSSSYQALELILIDDGSTDGTREIIKSYGSQVVFLTQKNEGAPRARNHGLRVSKGEFIQFLDSDDILDPDAISWRVGAMSPDVDGVFGDFDIIDSKGSFVRSEVFGEAKLWSSRKIIHFLLSEPGRLLINTPLHRRGKLFEIGAFDEKLPRCQDSNLHLRLAAKDATFLYRKKPIGGVRYHDSVHRISNHHKRAKDVPFFELEISMNYISIISQVINSDDKSSHIKILAENMYRLSLSAACHRSVAEGRSLYQEAVNLHESQNVISEKPTGNDRLPSEAKWYSMVLASKGRIVGGSNLFSSK